MDDFEGNNVRNNSFNWNQVLVDEVDLVRAAEHGRGDSGVSVSATSHEGYNFCHSFSC